MKFIIIFVALIICVFGNIIPIKHKNDEIFLGSRIVNGLPANVSQFPWHVEIEIKLGNETEHCGGSIIAPRWILTAAYCINNYTTIVVSIGFTSNNINSAMYKLSPLRTHIHPNYNPANLNNDVGLIDLGVEIPYDPRYIQPIQLPPLSQISNEFLGVDTRTMGFGRISDVHQNLSSTLNYATIRTIANSVCRELYGSSIVINSTLCGVGIPINQQIPSPCDGDTGGSLVYLLNGLWTQIGVMSFVSIRGCSVGDPSGYVRATSILNWVNATAGIPIRP